MNQKDDGGRAFPTQMLNVPFNEADDPKHNGMTLRDWFAGQALIGIITSSGWEPISESGNSEEPIPVSGVAYAIADAMLEARKQ